MMHCYSFNLIKKKNQERFNYFKKDSTFLLSHPFHRSLPFRPFLTFLQMAFILITSFAQLIKSFKDLKALKAFRDHLSLIKVMDYYLPYFKALDLIKSYFISLKGQSSLIITFIQIKGLKTLMGQYLLNLAFLPSHPYHQYHQHLINFIKDLVNYCQMVKYFINFKFILFELFLKFSFLL